MSPAAAQSASDGAAGYGGGPAAGIATPWLDAPKAALRGAHAAARLPHALLIQAAVGTGGDRFALWAAQLALCTATVGPPCGACAACRHAAEGLHPDLLLVRPTDDSQQIRIEQIRELSAELALTSHQGGYKVAIIDPADSLNRFAANALLKTVEEPPGRTLLILLAAQPSRLPATLRSRCQRIAVRAPDREQSLAWLEAACAPGDWGAVLDVVGEAPLAAAALDPAAVGRLRAETWRGLDEMCTGAADPAATAERWSHAELPLRLACIENWLTERIRRGVAPPGDAPELRANAHTPRADSAIKPRVLFALLDAARELKAQLSTPINRSLALESLLRSLGP
ncbi:MAG: DNA polymerase III subunit delta' [Steroidobacteraceae bacterium]